jgi:hypothetical protein
VVELIADSKRHFTHSCFNNVPISFSRWKMEFSELLLVCKFRAKPTLAVHIDGWLASL